MSSAEQLTLELFPPRTFTELIAESGHAGLSVHCNRRLRNSWYVKFQRGSLQRNLFIPACFEHAPDAIKTMLIEWTTLPPRPRRGNLMRTVRDRRRHLEQQIRAYLEGCGQQTTRRSSPVQKWPTIGNRYDLREVFDSVNNQFFDNRLTSFLRWGAHASKTSYQSTRKGPDGTPYHCITIAGVYNHPDVPRFAIESIMYHEMLHIHIPPRKHQGRNVIHGPDFKRLERAFPQFHAWRKWEREVFHTLRTDLRRRRKKTLLQHIMEFIPGV